MNISGVDRLHDSLLLTISGMFFKLKGGLLLSLCTYWGVLLGLLWGLYVLLFKSSQKFYPRSPFSWCWLLLLFLIPFSGKFHIFVFSFFLLAVGAVITKNLSSLYVCVFYVGKLGKYEPNYNFTCLSSIKPRDSSKPLFPRDIFMK